MDEAPSRMLIHQVRIHPRRRATRDQEVRRAASGAPVSKVHPPGTRHIRQTGGAWGLGVPKGLTAFAAALAPRGCKRRAVPGATTGRVARPPIAMLGTQRRTAGSRLCDAGASAQEAGGESRARPRSTILISSRKSAIASSLMRSVGTRDPCRTMKSTPDGDGNVGTSRCHGARWPS